MKSLKKVCVMGHFGFGHNLLNGQTVKTKILAEELEKQFSGEVMTVDTHGGVKSLLKAPFQVFAGLKNAENVVMLPAHNGLRVYAPLLILLKKFFSGRKLHYAVIGGWLASFLATKPLLKGCLKKFDGIYAETSTMKKALEELGLQNVVIMPNCKELPILSPQDLAETCQEPYRLCTFSRVMREKGIEDALEAVRAVNEAQGRTVYTLDIYGQVDAGQTEWFEDLQKQFPDYVRYGGLVPFDKSVDVLKDYFALLFPTRFYTEGIPGTIIDAYAAGVPVVSARWESFGDLVEDGRTGIGYDFGDTGQLTEVLMTLADHCETILEMKKNCLEKAENYLPGKGLVVLFARCRG